MSWFPDEDRFTRSRGVHFTSDPQSPTRGQGSFVGLQTHTGRVRFRNLQWKAV